jgi:hypothetical protein
MPARTTVAVDEDVRERLEIAKGCALEIPRRGSAELRGVNG